MNLRALGASASTASNWLNNVLISQVTPYAFDAIGWRFFFVFMACNLSNAVIAYFLFPETKGKTLEEIGRSSQNLFVGGSALINRIAIRRYER
jgi:hypothetical protein